MHNILLNDIIQYICYLKKNNTNGTLYFKQKLDLCEFSDLCNKNDLRNFIKSDLKIYDLCLENLERLSKGVNEKLSFYKMHYDGKQKFVFTISDNLTVYGFLIVDAQCQLHSNHYIKQHEVDCKDLQIKIKPLCYMLLNYFNKVEKNTYYSETLLPDIYTRAEDYLNKHYHEMITLESISKHCSCSPSTLERSFQNESGQTVIKYLKSVRMMHAKNLILNTKYSIKTISGMVGFAEPDYFSTVFKKYYNLSPSDMRKNSK